jgi:DNA-binding ferritin-like protein
MGKLMEQWLGAWSWVTAQAVIEKYGGRAEALAADLREMHGDSDEDVDQVAEDILSEAEDELTQ